MYDATDSYFLSPEKAKEISNTKFIRNTRYKNFSYYIYHAGDIEQFQSVSKYCISQYSDNICLKTNKFKDINIYIDNMYSNLYENCIINTYRYILNKYKKGIFVKIISNKLKIFLPFTKNKYKNTCGDRYNIDMNKWKSIEQFFEYICNGEGYTFNKNLVNYDTWSWYSNNCLIRYDFNVDNGQNNIHCIRDMLLELCLNREIPDIEFFINRKDFPIITRNHTEAYYHIWGHNYPLIDYKFEKYMNIFSMCTSNDNADMVFPTYEDWSRVAVTEYNPKRYYVSSSYNYDFDFNTKWEEKIPTAVFRGSSTGYGVTIDTNPRLMAAFISNSKDNIVYKGNKLLDACITKWNLRARKLINCKNLQTIDINDMKKKGIVLGNKLTPEEQSCYKYILNIDGHVSAFRLSLEMSMCSVILKVDSKWKIWFSDMLKPYEHYIPVKEDLSDLLEKIKWCRDNDDKCKTIGENCKKFYNMYLTKEGIFDYLQKLFIDVRNRNGNYECTNYKNFLCNIRYERRELYLLKNVINMNAIQIMNVYTTNNIQTLLALYTKTNTLKKHIIVKNDIIINDNIDIKRVCINNEYNDNEFEVILKKTKCPNKIYEYIHESFISRIISNENVVFNYGICLQEDGLYSFSKITRGITFKEYIDSENFSFNKMIDIIILIFSNIRRLQDEYDFVHYDLTPWNILLENCDNKNMKIYDSYLHIKTDIHPVILDLGKSSVVYKNKLHSYYDYKKNFKRDFFTFIMCTIKCLQKIHIREFNKFMKFANILHHIGYSKIKILKSHNLKSLTKDITYDSILEYDYEKLNFNFQDMVMYLCNLK